MSEWNGCLYCPLEFFGIVCESKEACVSSTIHREIEAWLRRVWLPEETQAQTDCAEEQR